MQAQTPLQQGAAFVQTGSAKSLLNASGSAKPKSIQRSMTSKEIELRRHLSSVNDLDPDQFLLRTEAEDTDLIRQGLTKGTAFEKKLERAAEHLVDGIDLPPDSQIIDEDERVAMAACFVRHAISRTSLSYVNWSSPTARVFYRLRQEWPYRLVLRVAFVGLCGVIIFEPAQTGGSGSAPASAATAIVETLCALIFLADLVAQLVCMSTRRFMKLPSCNVYALLVLTICIDTLIALGSRHRATTSLRISRPLRPLLLPFLSRTCDHMVVAILRSLPSLSDLIVVLVVAVVFFTLLGLSLFGHDPFATGGAAERDVRNDTSIFMLSQGWLPPEWRDLNGSVVWSTERSRMLAHLREPLSYMPTTMMHLAVAIFTADNFPHIMYESFDCAGVACNAYAGTTFFIIAVVLGHVILMTVFIAVVYEVYKRQHAYLVLYERVAERQALLAAFNLLDLNGDKRLSKGEFIQLITSVRPHVSKLTVELTFTLLDADRSDSIDQHEFVEAACALMVRVPKAAMNEWATCAGWRVVSVQRLVETRTFQFITDLAIVCYIALLLLIAGSADIEWSAASVQLLQNLDRSFVVYFALELCVKILGLSFETVYSDGWNRVDLFIVPLSLVALVVESLLDSPSSGAALRALRLLRLIRIGRIFRVFGKVVNSTRKTRVLVATFSRFGRVMLPMVAVLMMLIYAFAVVGMETLRDALSPHSSASVSNCAPFCPSFNTLPLAWRTLFQMLIGANFTPLLVEATARSGAPATTAIFFLSFVTICHVLMLSSLLVALMLDLYTVETDKVSRAQKEDKMSVLCAEIAPETQAPVHAVLYSSVREKFIKYDVDESGALRLEELAMLLADLSGGGGGGSGGSGGSSGGGFSHDEVERIFSEMDNDNSGLIELDEFLPWWRKRGIGQVFKLYDADSSGSIDAKELEGVMSELGVVMSAAEVADALRQLDADGSGSISFEEYLGWFEVYDLQSEFERYDTDQSGSINRREFLKLTRSLGLTLTRKEAETVFARLDASSDGAIGFDEFLPWWRRVKATAKGFMVGQAIDAKQDWEGELFLDKHDRAEEQAKQLMRTILDEIETGIGDGTVERTPEAVLSRLRKEAEAFTVDAVQAIGDAKEFGDDRVEREKVEVLDL